MSDELPRHPDPMQTTFGPTPPHFAEASSLAAPIGSAIAHQSRRQVWEQLAQIKIWVARLESGLQRDGVIPWMQLQSLSEATERLIYSAGQVNALRVAGLVKPLRPATRSQMIREIQDYIKTLRYSHTDLIGKHKGKITDANVLTTISRLETAIAWIKAAAA